MNTPPKTSLSFVDGELTLYCEATTSNEPLICRQIREAAHLHPKAHWISGPLVGTLLQTLVSVSQAKRVLDIGTFLGYSAAYMASGNPEVRVISLERDAEFAKKAKALLDVSEVGSRITIQQAEAHAWLSVQPESEFDLIFFDSNRSDLMLLYPHLVRSLRPGAVLIMDNACLRRKVLTPSRPWEHDTAAFNAAIQRDPAFVTTLLPVRDGVLLAHKRPIGHG
jgi:caffeoyl-CoA O-methyltransferase